MGILEKKLQQCRKPTGERGREIVEYMNMSHRELTRWGVGHIDTTEAAQILDIGCGGGKTINELAHTAKSARVFGIDYSPDCVEMSSSLNADLIKDGRVKILQATVSALPFDNDSFDLVTAVETYYFWPDLVNDLKEIRRVLKPGGTILLINEVYKHEKFAARNEELSREGNFPYHSPEEYEAFLTSAGFVSIEIDTREENNWITAVGRKPI